MSDREKHARQWAWILLVAGAGCWALAAHDYFQFAELERTGGSKRVSRRTADIYRTLGKGGFLIVWGGLGSLFWAASAWNFVKGYRGPRRPARPEGDLGGNLERPPAPPSSQPCPKCGGEINAGASFCRHCREWLS